ncbi:MAG: pyocin knob domain-containing protein, partial [Desulfotomaculaceae bacterium]
NSFKASCPGIPFTSAGTLETDFIFVSGSDWGYGKQIAKAYNLTDIYVRSAINATTWSAWKKVTLGDV